MSGIGTQKALSVNLVLPEAGAWSASVVLDSGAAPSGKVTLTVGDLELHGTVARSGLDYTGKPSATVFGGYGWDSLVSAPISFQSDAGVKLSTVLKALGAAAEESIEQPTDKVIGNYYECVASRAGAETRYADALNELLHAGHIATWRVDPDGVTRFTARVSAPVTSRATPMRIDAKMGKTVYGVDSVASLLPGNTINGVAIGRVHIDETPTKLEATIHLPGVNSVSSILDSVRRMVASELSDRLRTYRVAKCGTDGRLDLVPPQDASHLPEMHNVEQWCLGGTKIFPREGAEILVLFRDDNHTRPVAFACRSDENEADGQWLSRQIKIETYGQASAYFREDGQASLLTTEDNKYNGRPVFFTVAPSGFVWQSPYGRMRLDASGLHYRDHVGARFDVGSLGMPAPLNQMSTYFSATAATISLNASLVCLGAPLSAKDAVALSTPINTFCTALVAAAATAIGAAGPGGPAAATTFASTMSAALLALTLAMPSKSTSAS